MLSCNKISRRKQRIKNNATDKRKRIQRRPLLIQSLENRRVLTTLIDGFSESIYRGGLTNFTPTDLGVEAQTGTMVFATSDSNGPLYRLDTDLSLTRFLGNQQTGAPQGLPGGLAVGATDIEYQDGFVYTVNNQQTLWKLDPTTDLSGATPLVTFPGAGIQQGIAIKDDVLYATSGTRGNSFWKFDLDTQQLTELSNDFPVDARGLEYVAATDQFFMSTRFSLYEVFEDGSYEHVSDIRPGFGNLAVDGAGQFAYTTATGAISQTDLTTGTSTAFVGNGGVFRNTSGGSATIRGADELDFGPASSGTGTSLYVTNGLGGRINEIVGDFPAPLINRAPSLTDLTVTATINENDFATFSGTVLDSDAEDTFVLDVDWADGTTNRFDLGLAELFEQEDSGDIVNWNPDTREFSVRHRYLDDGGSPGNGTPSDEYIIAFSLTDAFGSPAERNVGGNLIVNGTFETGTLGGWNTNVIGNGSWEINGGNFDPPGPAVPTYPASGQFNVVSTPLGPSTKELSQTFDVPNDVESAVVVWDDIIQNFASWFADPEQEFRVQLADNTGVTIQEIFSTNPGDIIDKTQINRRVFDVTSALQSHEGESLTLSFVEQDEYGYFNVTLDQIELVVTTAPLAVNVENVDPTLAIRGDETLAPEFAGLFSRSGTTIIDDGTLDVHTVEVDWDGDEIIDETFTIDPSGSAIRDLNLNHQYTAEGTYTVTVTVRDDDASQPVSQSFQLDVLLNEPPIANDDIDGQASVSEDDEVVDLTGNVLANDTDPDGDTISIVAVDDSSISNGILDFNDGTVTFSPNASFESLSLGEIAVETFSYTIMDPLGETDSANVQIQIVGENDAPNVTQLASSHQTFETRSLIGETVTVSGGWSDVDHLDTHTINIDWGDGTNESFAGQAGVPTPTGSFSQGHQYQNGGIYTIIVTVEDQHGATATDTTNAFVTGVGIVDGTLFVIGTDSKDHVNIRLDGDSEIKVDAKLGNGKSDVQRFDSTDVDSIEIYVGDGNDHVKIHEPNINSTTASWYTSSIIDGGNGKDHLTGGSGRDVLVGGLGDDHLDGGSGMDILIGGDGKDKLKGGSDNDLLIGGITSENDSTAFDAALTSWSEGDADLALLHLGTLTDDNDKDDLAGENGDDFLVGGVGDKVKQ